MARRWLLLVLLLATARFATAQAPQRIVSLLPSLTETVCELGACDRLVGVDSYSNWPQPVTALPHVGGVDDANVERILALRPDLVLAGSTSRAAARLQQLGVRVVGVDVKTVADVRQALETVARTLGAGGAAAAWRRIDAGVDAAARSVPAVRRGTTVYVEVDSAGYAAGAASHIGELLTRLGAVNIVPAALGSVPKLNPEFVVRADPQLLVIPARAASSIGARPGWDRMRAVREQRVCALDAAQEDVVMRPGPRLAEAARVLAHCLGGAP